MTRINSAIPVKNLTDEHLLAEHREIKRLVSYFNKSKLSGSLNKIPDSFRLGGGHVLFFLNKMGFIYKRYLSLYNECLNRGFNVTDYSSNFSEVDGDYFNDYVSTVRERKLLECRIYSKIKSGKLNYYHYYSSRVTRDQACSLLLTGKILTLT